MSDKESTPLLGEENISSEFPDEIQHVDLQNQQTGVGDHASGYQDASHVAVDVVSSDYRLHHHQPGNMMQSERTPLALTWNDVSYVIKTSSTLPCFRKRDAVTEKTILRNVSGCAKPGQILAIVGASGAGKSTLLDILAGRKNSGVLSGSVKVNGQIRDSSFRRVSGYVTQDDCLMGSQTVYETLMFRANLQLPREGWTEEARKQRVEEVISELSLEKVRNSPIGTQFQRGISGGEKKRVSIGCELVTNPSILFLDEPSTGLDAFNSLATLEALSRLAHKQNRTVVCTIHQPRSNIFDLFDQLIVLSLGQVVYAGSAVDALPYFSRITRTPCPTRGNPADLIVDIVIRRNELGAEDLDDEVADAVKLSTSNPLRLSMDGELSHSAEDANLLQPGSLAVAYRESPEYENILDEISGLEDQYGSIAVVAEGGERRSEFATSWPTQLYYVSKRAFVNLWRNPLVARVSVIQNIVMGLIVGLLYFQMPVGTKYIQDRLGALFFIVTNQAFGQMASLNNFILGRELFSRERAAGVYTVSSFFISQTLVELPLALLYPSCMGIIAYWMMGLQADAAKFFIFMAILIIFAATITSLFSLIGAFSPNVTVAQILAPLFIVISFMLSGFYISLSSIPVYFEWISYLSSFRYSYPAIVYNEFTGLTICGPLSAACPEPTGESVLENLDFENVSIIENVLILFTMIIVFRGLAYLSLVVLRREKR